MAREKTRSPELDELADHVGTFIRYWGFKKVHGQIWAHLFTSAQPLDAAALMDRLGISKALVSMSLHDLLEYRVILSDGKSTRGTLVYRANPDVMEAILQVLRTRERNMLTQMERSFGSLQKQVDAKKTPGLDPERVAQLGGLIGAAGEMLDAFLSFRQIDLALFEKFQQPLGASPSLES